MKKHEREREVEAYLKRQVERTDGQMRKVQWIGHRGAPDRLVLFPKLCLSVWVELKSTTGKLSTLQAREILLLEGCGSRVYIVRSEADVNFFMSYIHEVTLSRSTNAPGI